MGVHAVVTGGQSMNPRPPTWCKRSSRCRHPRSSSSRTTSNIIPVAEQVDAQTSRTVRVVPTRGIAEGIASPMSYDPQSTAEANADSMTEVASGVLAGEVTQAVRESTSDAGPIYRRLAGIRREASAQCSRPWQEHNRTAQRHDPRDHELLTVIVGETPTTTPPPASSRGSKSITGTSGRGRGRPTALPYYFGLE